jgi:hypothetical protein
MARQLSDARLRGHDLVKRPFGRGRRTASVSFATT